MADIILEARNLKKYFETPKGMLHAVDGISFSIERGKTLGIVGESGCGKSTLGRTILRLIEPTAGQIFFEGRDITKLNIDELRLLRREMQIIFQDPFSSLDPRKSISQLISEPLEINRIAKNKEELATRVQDLMQAVGLSARLANAYPHELDGGRRQRIGIARALALNPKFIVCDEPVSALDVSIQAQILNLLKDLQIERKLTYIFITHNLSVVNHFSDEIIVCYLGTVVEQAPTDILFEHPMHPYTKALLSAIPIPDLKHKRQRVKLIGEIPSPINLPEECRFSPRCPYACETCQKGVPPLVELERNHFVACPIATNL